MIHDSRLKTAKVQTIQFDLQGASDAMNGSILVAISSLFKEERRKADVWDGKV